MVSEQTHRVTRLQRQEALWCRDSSRHNRHEEQKTDLFFQCFTKWSSSKKNRTAQKVEIIFGRIYVADTGIEKPGRGADAASLPCKPPYGEIQIIPCLLGKTHGTHRTSCRRTCAWEEDQSREYVKVSKTETKQRTAYEECQ